MKKYILNEMQLKLLNICSVNKGNSSLYLTQVKIEIKSALNLIKFEQACSETFSSNEYLQSRLKMCNNEIYFEKSDTAPTLTIHDAKNNIDILNTFLQNDLKTNFDIYNEIPYRICLMKFNEEKYFFIFTHHHILFDFNSFQKILFHIFNNYQDIAPEPISHKSPIYISPNNNYLNNHKDSLEKCLNNSISTLPGQYHHKSQVNSYYEHRFKLPQHLTQIISQICNDNNVSLSTFFYAIWSLILAKFSYTEKVSFGITRSLSQNQPDNEYGLHLATIPLCSVINKKITGKEFLKYLSASVEEIKQNIIAPITNKPKEKSLFNCLLDYKNQDFSRNLIHKYPSLIESADFSSYTEMPLIIEIWNSEAYYSGKMTCDPEQIDIKVFPQIEESIVKLIEYINLTPQNPIATCCLIDYDKYIDNIKHKHNIFLKKTFKHNHLYEYFKSSVNQYSSKPSLIISNKYYTYQQLSNLVDFFSMCLIKTGAKPHKPIAIILPRSIEFIALSIAILKIGSIAVPLDSLHPNSRIHANIKDSGSTIVAFNNSTAEKINDLLDITMFNIDIVLEDIQGKVNNHNIHLNNLSHIIYTSGTTGTAKGVYLKHIGIINTIENLTTELALSCDDVFLATASISFDMSLADLWLPLALGATLVFADEKEKRDPQTLIEYIDKFKVSVMEATPALWDILINSGFTQIHHKLKLISGGEALTVKLARKMMKLGKVYNLYGPTENSIYTTMCKVQKNTPISIGHELSNTAIEIFDKFMCPAPHYALGEIYITGINLSPGYTNSSLIEKMYTSFQDTQNIVYYKSGDISYRDRFNNIILQGRDDEQTKINGHQVNLTSIQSVLEGLDIVKKAILKIQETNNFYQKVIIAYIIPKSNVSRINLKQIIVNKLSNELPYYLIPTKIIFTNKFPLTINGKIDFTAIIESIENRQKIEETDQRCQKKLESYWQQLLNLNIRPTITDNFFELGGSSFTAGQLANIIHQGFGLLGINVVDIYQHPTLTQQLKMIRDFRLPENSKLDQKDVLKAKNSTEKIAIVGIACRFPKIENPDELWDVLINSKKTYRSDVLKEPLQNSQHTYTSGSYENIHSFDYQFFGISKNEAENISSEQRVLLEVCWEALEDAGYATNENKKMNVGTFLGGSSNSNSQAASNIFSLEMIANQINKNSEFLANRIAYCLNLTGPAINISTACSTSLVSIIKACQSILFNECDMAIAGGVSLIEPDNSGYIYQEGAIFSQDGICKVFDSNSTGTIPSSGAGIVILKPLQNAIDNSDLIYGVIDGFSINNDGNEKSSYTAPSVSSQIDCIKKAMRQTSYVADDISYIETHGTGTRIGDAIEIRALAATYKSKTTSINLGSVKANIGHTNQAAGVAGLIKVLLMFKNNMIPAQISIKELNKELNGKDNQFSISTINKSWNIYNKVSAVSSFGLGGTNAHILVSNFPDKSNDLIPDVDTLFIVPISSKNDFSLEKQILKLKTYLVNHTNDELNLLNIAYTLQYRRPHFNKRTVYTVKSMEELIEKLTFKSSGCINTGNMSNINTWLEGNNIDWSKLQPETLKGKTVHLPSYAWNHTKLTNKDKIEHILKSSESDTRDFLVSIWKKILNIKHQRLCSTSDFFDLGGDSLSALEFVAILEKSNINMTLESLYKNRTLESLVNLIDRNQLKKPTNSSEFLIQLNKGSKDTPPLFLVHPVGGTAFTYLQLVEELDKTIPVYAFHDPGMIFPLCQDSCRLFQ
jgi:amino acid adenylation domain-containing protein